MSIYCSRVAVGHDEWPEEQVGRVVVHPGNMLRRITKRWPQAGIETAHIPAWCDVPAGSNDDCDRVAPWLRLMVYTQASSTMTVLLDEAAARALAEDLLAWADAPKTRELS